MNKKIITVISVIITLLILLGLLRNNSDAPVHSTWWEFQSIDTMKYSRDIAREKLNDSSFDSVIDRQVRDIAQTGATHVAIATPYDEEFYPILERWVASARKNNLKVWFRGNFSGWEGWFDYPRIDRTQHIRKTEEFILNNKDLFEDGDVFSACPECENGGPGDPRRSGDVEGHRQFLIDEYKVTKAAFRRINKNVASNFNSMNGDVARLVMDKKTTKALDGIVAIDHYVKTPEILISDVRRISKASGGKVVLGEFGVPIPDIHGKMSQEEQALWIRTAMSGFIQMPEVVGLSYWTNTGSSTALWGKDGEAREAVGELTTFYKAHIVRVIVRDEAGHRVKDPIVNLGGKRYFADSKGDFYLPYFENLKEIELSAIGYFNKNATLTDLEEQKIVVASKNPTLIYKILRAIKSTI